MIDRAATQTELLGEPVDVPSASFQGIELAARSLPRGNTLPLC